MLAVWCDGPQSGSFLGQKRRTRGCGFHNDPSGVTNQPGNSAILAACVWRPVLELVLSLSSRNHTLSCLSELTRTFPDSPIQHMEGHGRMLLYHRVGV